MNKKAKKLRERILGTFTSDLRESNFYQIDFVGSLKECLRELGERKIENILCYGLGSFSNSVDITSRYQLALLLLLHQFLTEVETNFSEVIDIYDPSFDELDKVTLKSFTIPKFRLINDNEYCGRKIVINKQNACTLIYMPHLDKYLYNNLIGTNWDSDSLGRLVIFGNSFREMIDNEITPRSKRELYYLNLIVSNFRKDFDKSSALKNRTKSKRSEQESSEPSTLIEITLDDGAFDPPDIFNSLSFQFVNNSWLLSNCKKIEKTRLVGWTCVTSQPRDEWNG